MGSYNPPTQPHFLPRYSVGLVIRQIISQRVILAESCSIVSSGWVLRLLRSTRIYRIICLTLASPAFPGSTPHRMCLWFPSLWQHVPVAKSTKTRNTHSLAALEGEKKKKRRKKKKKRKKKNQIDFSLPLQEHLITGTHTKFKVRYNRIYIIPLASW